MRGLQTILLAGAGTLVTLALRAQSADDAAPAADLRKTIGALSAVIDEIDANAAERKAAWKTQEEDQSEEKTAPPRVLELEEELRALEMRRNQLVERIRSGAGDGAEVLRAIEEADHEAVVTALVPIAAEVCRDRDHLARTLITAAKRFDPVPSAVRRAMEKTGTETVARFLVVEGVAQHDGGLLRSAVKTGVVTAIEEVASLAESSDSELRMLGLRGLEGLPLIDDCPAYLRLRISSMLGSLRSEQAGVYFIHFLGRCQHPSDTETLLRIATDRDGSTSLRSAAIGALGLAGRAHTELLAGILGDDTDSPEVRRAAARALGASADPQATEPLIARLRDATVSRDVVRALERISGERFGPDPGAWLRWHRATQSAE